MMRRVDALVPPPDRVRVLSYLPAAHIAERAYAHYAHIFGGGLVTTVVDMARLPQALATVRPTSFMAVPRVWEKIKDGIERSLATKPPAVGAGVEAAVDRVWRMQRGEPVAPSLEATQRQAEEAIF